MFRYKQWTRQGWREVAAMLAARGLRVLATGGPSAGERLYLDELMQTHDAVEGLQAFIGKRAAQWQHR